VEEAKQDGYITVGESVDPRTGRKAFPQIRLSDEFSPSKASEASSSFTMRGAIGRRQLKPSPDHSAFPGSGYTFYDRLPPHREDPR